MEKLEPGEDKINENEKSWILLFISILAYLLPKALIAYLTSTLPIKDVRKDMIIKLTEEIKLETERNELSRKLVDLPHSQMKEILEEAADTDDSLGILNFMVSQPSLFPTGPKCTATILSKLLDMRIARPKVLQLFNRFNLTLKAF